MAVWLIPTIICAQGEDKTALLKRIHNDSITIEKLKGELKVKKQLIDTLQLRVEIIGRVPTIIYRTCLLYPLTQKYNKGYIDDCKECVDNLSYWNNSQYDERVKIRRQSLDKYKEYNDELLTFFKEFRKTLANDNWTLNPLMRVQARSGLEKLSYYKIYNQKTISIDYLNGIVNRFLKMINQPSISQNAYDELINDLVPEE